MSGDKSIEYGRSPLGWSEFEYLQCNDAPLDLNPEFLYLLDCLFATHVGIDNDPEEPYRGVQALFSGDRATQDPEGIRANWEITSPYQIQRIS